MASSPKPPEEPAITPVLMETPLGPVSFFFSEKGLVRLFFAGENYPQKAVSGGRASASRTLPEGVLQTWRRQVAQALEDYFAGNPGAFDSLPLDPQGTPFQLRVWQELRKIPWGETISYKELAARAGNPQACRAVGQANGANPLPLIVPCHRVIAADGSLGGYSSGLHRKRWLLEHEGAEI